MQGRKQVWAAWSANAILVYCQQEGGTVKQLSLPRQMKADLRYFLRLYRLNDGTPLLRSSNNSRTWLDLANGGTHFRPVKDLPEEFASLPPYQVIPFKDGTVAGTRPNLSQLILWQPGGPLHVRNLPEEFVIRDVDRDDKKRLWICGSLPTQKLKSLEYRRALAMSDDNGVSWQVREVIHGRLKIAWQSLLSGAEVTYRTINVVNDQIVLGAETGDYNDTSTFLFVRDAHGKWRSGILKDDILRAVLPVGNEELEVISHYGQAVLVPSRGKWRYRSLLPRFRHLIQRTAVRPPEDARYEILDAQSVPGGKRILVISVRLPREKRLVRFGEAVVILTEDGDRLVTFHGQEEAEIITAI